MKIRKLAAMLAATGIATGILGALGDTPVAAAAAAAVAAPVVWSIDSGGNGHGYEVVVVPGGIDWPQARDAAAARGGYLVTITSAAENSFVYQNVTADPAGWSAGAQYHVGPWLGGYQDHLDAGFAEPAGGWKWVTGEAWSFRSPSGWVNNLYGSGVSDENAMHMINDFGFTPADAWNDYPASTFPNLGRPRPTAYAVEYIPEPGAACLIVAMGMLQAVRRRR